MKRTCKYSVVSLIAAFCGLEIKALPLIAGIGAILSLWRIHKSNGALRGRLWAVCALLIAFIGLLLSSVGEQEGVGLPQGRPLATPTGSPRNTGHGTSTVQHSGSGLRITNPIVAQVQNEKTSSASYVSTSSTQDFYDFDRTTARIINDHLRAYSNTLSKFSTLSAAARVHGMRSGTSDVVRIVDGAVYKSYAIRKDGVVVNDRGRLKTIAWTSLSDISLLQLRPDLFDGRVARASNLLAKSASDYIRVSNAVASGMVFHRTFWTNRRDAVEAHLSRERRLLLQERQIWQEAFWNFERANEEALRKYPGSDYDTLEDVQARDRYAETIENRLNRTLCDKYDIDVQQLREVNEKGLKKYWPGEERPEVKEKKQREAGKMPQNDPWDAKVPEVAAYLKNYLNDPNVQFVSWYKPVLEKSADQYYWRVRVKFRAKNVFGAYILKTADFYIQHNRVTRYREQE